MSLWDRMPYVWKVCTEQAWMAFMEGSVPVGAVVANANGEVVARDRNRIGEKTCAPQQIAGHRLAHAEMNVLLRVRCQRDSQETYALYTALEPCPLCMGAFYMSGLRCLYYAARDGHAGSTNLLGKTPYLSLKPVTVHGPCLELEALFQTLHLVYGMSEGRFSPWLIERFVQLYPKAGLLSRNLLDEGYFARAVAQRATARDMVSDLAPLLEPEALPEHHDLSTWALQG